MSLRLAPASSMATNSFSDGMPVRSVTRGLGRPGQNWWPSPGIPDGRLVGKASAGGASVALQKLSRVRQRDTGLGLELLDKRSHVILILKHYSHLSETQI